MCSFFDWQQRTDRVTKQDRQSISYKRMNASLIVRETNAAMHAPEMERETQRSESSRPQQLSCAE